MNLIVAKRKSGSDSRDPPTIVAAWLVVILSTMLCSLCFDYNQFCWHWWIFFNLKTNYLIQYTITITRGTNKYSIVFYTQNKQSLLHGLWLLYIRRIISLSIMKDRTPNYEHEVWFKSCHKRTKISIDELYCKTK